MTAGPRHSSSGDWRKVTSPRGAKQLRSGTQRTMYRGSARVGRSEANRFLVALPRAGDLLLCAKDLFVAARTVRHRLQSSRGERGRFGFGLLAIRVLAPAASTPFGQRKAFRPFGAAEGRHALGPELAGRVRGEVDHHAMAVKVARAGALVRLAVLVDGLELDAHAAP